MICLYKLKFVPSASAAIFWGKTAKSELQITNIVLYYNVYMQYWFLVDLSHRDTIHTARL